MSAEAILALGLLIWVFDIPDWIQEKTRQLRLANDSKARDLKRKTQDPDTYDQDWLD